MKDIIATLKTSHLKFEDPDFGPNDNDEHGVLALYGPLGPPPPAGHSKYPDPQTIRWDRPQYADDKFQHEHSSKVQKEGDEDDDDEEVDDTEDDDDDEFGPSSKADKVIKSLIFMSFI